MIDLDAAERFILESGRLLDRHRMAVLLHGAPAAQAIEALRAYRNPDGGFGHALEPDVRGPESEPVAVLHALDVLAETDALHDDMVAGAAKWIAEIADADGGVPMAMPAAAGYPHAPWMAPSAAGSHLTFGIAARLLEAGVSTPWLDRAGEWCWTRLEQPDQLGAYWIKFALLFLDHVPDESRAAAAIERFRDRLDADGSMPVEGGTADERLTALTLSDRPGRRSRALFDESLIESDLVALEEAQQEDGGWKFDWLAWSPGQEVEWRGALTFQALATLDAHGRLPPVQP